MLKDKTVILECVQVPMIANGKGSYIDTPPSSLMKKEVTC